jgi:polyisoprenoid-binding protein YceI
VEGEHVLDHPAGDSRLEPGARHEVVDEVGIDVRSGSHALILWPVATEGNFLPDIGQKSEMAALQKLLDAGEYWAAGNVQLVKRSTTTPEEPSMSTIQSAPAVTGDYTIDASHTRLGFTARHAMVTKVRGQFSGFEGTAHVDVDNPAASSVQLTIDPATVSTGSPDRDGHLRSADFFDTEAFPQWSFRSTEVSRDGQTWRVTGDLTLKDVTKPVTIEFEETGTAVDPFGNTRLGFEGSLVVNRKDWGLTWNVALEAGGVLVSEKVTLEFDISAIKNA